MDPRRRARTGIELGRTLMRGNRHDEAIEAFRRARTDLGDADPDLTESITSELISAAWWYPEHVPIAVCEIERVDEEALHGGVGSDLLKAALGYWETRRGQDRMRALELVRAALAPGRMDLLGTRGLHLAAYTLTMGGYPDESLEVYDRVLAAAYARGDNVLASSSALFRAYTQLRRGELEQVESDLARFSELTAYQTTQLYSHAFHAELAMEKGDLAAAEASIAASRLPDALPPNGHLTFFQLARGRLRLEQHRHEDAIRELRQLGDNIEALQIENSAFYDWRPHLALAQHAAGRRDEALAVAIEASTVPAAGARRSRSASPSARSGSSKAEHRATGCCARPSRCSPARSGASSTRRRSWSSAPPFAGGTSVPTRASISAPGSSSPTSSGRRGSRSARRPSSPPPARDRGA